MLMNRRTLSLLMLVLLAVLFVSVNLFSNLTFRASRIDLTGKKIFTLSEGTRNILHSLEEPVTLRFFYSRKLASDFPRIRNYAGRVQDLLEEIRSVAGHKLVLEVIDPEPFSTEEDRAMSLGLKGAPTTRGEVLYFGLAGSNLVDGQEQIPFFTDEREQYLEYDLVKLIQNLSRPEKPVLGVVTNLPLDTGAGGLRAAMRGRSASFMIYEALLDRFRIEFLEQDFARIPGHIEVLLIAHPKPLNDKTLYAVDQFMVRGGKALVFVDPHSEVSLTTGPNGQPVQGYTQASHLERLMTRWGVTMNPERIVADRGTAQRVQTGLNARRQLADYVLWMALGHEQMNNTDLVTADIDRLNLGTAGALTPAEGAGTRFIPLITSSADAMTLDLDYVKSGPGPDDLLRNFAPQDAPFVIGARIVGPVSSAFPEGPPDPGEDKEAAREQTAARHIGQGLEEAHIIIVADSDIFDDRFWVHTQSYLGERIAQPIADNAKFILNAVDNLMGSNDLISLRTREKADRPFTVVEALRRQAEARFLAEEEALQNEIAAAEQRLVALQGQPSPDQAPSLLSSPRTQEIQGIRKQLLESRAALRAVQGNLRREIEALGTRVRLFSIVLMPLLVTVAAVLAAVMRRHRRKTLVTEKGQAGA